MLVLLRMIKEKKTCAISPSMYIMYMYTSRYIYIYSRGHVNQLFIRYIASSASLLRTRILAHIHTNNILHTREFFLFHDWIITTLSLRVTHTHTRTQLYAKCTYVHTVVASSMGNRNSSLRGFDLSSARANFHSTSLRKPLEIRKQDIPVTSSLLLWKKRG